jgi:hypothetical protein
MMPAVEIPTIHLPDKKIVLAAVRVDALPKADIPSLFEGYIVAPPVSQNALSPIKNCFQ